MERMNFGQRILEVFIQIGLIFYSYFIFMITWSLILALCAYFMEEGFLEKWKNFKPKGGTTYYEKPSYRVEEDVFGNINVKYDDGERYKFSADQKVIIFLIFLSLPLRCISLLLSIIALIFPPLNVKVKNYRCRYANILLDVYWC